MPLTKFSKYCSIDGDADRLIYFFIDHRNQFRILDGDRFSVLYATFLSIKLQDAKLLDDVKIGVVQTAYANGRSTDYIVNTMVRLIRKLSRVIASLESTCSMCTNWS